MNDFKEFFENLSNNILIAIILSRYRFCLANDFNEENLSFPELNQPLYFNEAHSAIKQLKRNKSAGSDYILKEYLFECFDILSSIFVTW